MKRCLWIGMLVTCFGCSPGEDTTATAPPAVEKQTRGSQQVTLCDLIPKDEVGVALGGKLVVKGIDSANEVNCIYKLGRPSGPALEGANLIVHKVQPAMYFAEKQHEGRDYYEPLGGVGREAYLLNQAQVNALLDDDTAIRLGLAVITLGEPIITKPEARTAVVSLATQLVGEL